MRKLKQSIQGRLPNSGEEEIIDNLKHLPQSNSSADVARRLLDHRKPNVRMAALDVLVSYDSRKGVLSLIRLLGDPSWKVRMHAAELSARLFARKVPKQFLRLLRDKHELVRVQAVESLAYIGDRNSDAVAAVRSNLSDRSPLVRSYAAATLGVIGKPSDRNLLAKRLPTEKSDKARLGILAGLYALGDDSAFSQLLKLLDSDDFEVRTGTAATLARSIATGSNIKKIREAIAKALRKERSVNTRAHFRELIKELDSLHG